jgi:hypothetical protein
VTAAIAQRVVLLGVVALLAGLGALVIAERIDIRQSSSNLPEPVPAPDGGWYEALAAPESSAAYERTTACGITLEREMLGVSHPVLVCGAKLYIGSGDTEVLTQVVGRGPGNAAVQFGLTEALARELGVNGREMIRWRFARAQT